MSSYHPMDDLVNIESIIRLSRKSGNPTACGTLDDYIDRMWSAGLYSGFALTDNGDGTVDIAAGEGILRSSASATAPLQLIAVAGVSNLALTNNSLNYIYVDYNAGTPQILTGTSTAEFNCLDKCVLYRLSREGSEVHYISMMANNIDANRSYRRKDFEIGSIDIGSGAKVSEVGSRYLAVTAGSYWIILSRLTSTAKDTSGSDTFDLYYRNGSGGWTKTSENSQVNNTQYDDGSGTLAALGNGRYGTRFIFMSISETGSHLDVVMGQDEHKTQEEAENDEIPGDLPPEVSSVGVPLALITVEKDGANFASILNVSERTFQTSLPTQHNNVSGLQGGIAGEYYHLSSALYALLTDANAQHEALHTDGNPEFASVKVAGSVQIGNNTDPASAANVGAQRYREDATGSYIEVVKKIGVSPDTYAWRPVHTDLF